jgi:hypothetical protein
LDWDVVEKMFNERYFPRNQAKVIK